MRRLHTLTWLIRQTPDRARAVAALIVVKNAALLGLLWTRACSHDAGATGSMAAWAGAAAAASALLDFAIFFWLYRNLTSAYVRRMVAGAAAMMDGVVTLAPDRTIVLFNPAAEAMFGYAARDVLGKSVDLLIPPRLREWHREHLEAFARSGEPNRPLGEPGAISALRASGDEFPIDASVMQVGSGAGRLFSIVLRDATRRLEGRLRAERLAAIVEASSDAIVGLDVEGRVTHWNAGAEKMMGYAAREVLGRPLDAMVPAEHPMIAPRVIQGERIFGHVSRRIRKDGTLVDVSLSTAPIRDEHGKVTGISTVARDITGQLAAETARAKDIERLRGLARRLMLVEESHKRLLGRELHDQVGGNLATLGLSLQLIRQESDPATLAAISRRLEFCEDLVRQTAGAVRSVLGNLRPTALDELGLLAALGQLAADMNNSGLMRFTVEGEEPMPRLGADCEIALYRIAQEAFTNAAKHSGGAHVRARLSQAPGQVTLVIVDDGHGLQPPEQPWQSAGLGLTTMRERAEAVGATLEVAPDADGGTAVIVRLPCNLPTARDAE